MGQTSTVEYKGDLRTSAIHLKSGKDIITDAPVDNNGKGEAFSPTDLVATALASCMITIMGIRAKKVGIDLIGTKAQIKKIMASSPRRIEEVIIHVTMPKQPFNSNDREMLEKSARTCPVALSLHPDTKQTIIFHWQ